MFSNNEQRMQHLSFQPREDGSLSALEYFAGEMSHLEQRLPLHQTECRGE